MILLDIQIVEQLRELEKEKIYGFYLQDNKIVKLEELGTLETHNDHIISMVSQPFDGFIHNHTSELEFSSVDKRFMLPNIYYLLVTPSKVLCALNGEKEKCKLF